MKQNMGRLLKRVFINKDIDDDHFIDICMSNKNERLLWCCSKNRHGEFFAGCLDEKDQEGFYKAIGASYDQDDFEEKIREYFSNCSDYMEEIRGFCDKKEWGIIPRRIWFDRQADPHVLMSDRKTIYDILSQDRCENLLFELIMNSVLEFQIGEANEISVKVSDGVYEITDNGGGIAVEDTEQFRDYEWKRIFIYPRIVYDYPKIFKDDSSVGESEDVFDSPYCNAEFYKKCPEYYYKSSSPKNKDFPGSTVAHAQCYSKAMKVTTVRGNKEYVLEFENGYCISGRQINSVRTLGRGTHIVWEPDRCCFNDVIVPAENIVDFLNQQALLNAGLKIHLDYNGAIYDFYYPHGLKDYMASKVNSLEYPIESLKYKFITEYNEAINNKEELEICIAIGNSGFIEGYHNYRKMSFGDTMEDVYDYIVDWFNNFSKRAIFSLKYEKYKKVVFTREDIERHISVVISSFSEQTSFTNGVRIGVENPFFKEAIKKAVRGIFSKAFAGWTEGDKVEETKRFIDLMLASRDEVQK